MDKIVERAVNGFTALATSHHQVYLQLQDSRQVREDLKYLLYRALNLSLVSPRHEGLVSLKTSGILQWETTAFRSGSATTASVSVPWLESLGPLRWPLVVHEVAHYFLPFGGEAAEQIARTAQANAWSADAFEEILADSVAQRHFGAAYSFALAREGYLYSYRKHVTGGLSVEQRLKVLGEPNDLLSALPKEWGLSHRESLNETQAEIPTETVVAMRVAAVEVLDELNSAHEWTAEPNRDDVVAAGIELLNAAEPAPAVPRPDAAEVIDRAIQERHADPSADVGYVADTAVHTPLTDGEIFEAAWRAEVCRQPEEMGEALGSPLTEEKIQTEMALVAKQDIWLARSLQSAAVHSWLLKTTQMAEAT